VSQPKSEQAGRDGQTKKHGHMDKTKVRAWESVVTKNLRSKSTLGVFCSWVSFHLKGVSVPEMFFVPVPARSVFFVPVLGVERFRTRFRAPKMFLQHED